ncbi:MAG: hypothetical protein FD135_3629 [Comamonadaceae bacterium]|nr:MAG: hypothetical protein FD135_3629 [Comamonadaceae bacterium]
MTTKHASCLELGVCQGLSPDKCPDCTSWECEVQCSPDPQRHIYQFAPGVIEHPTSAPQFDDPFDVRWLVRILCLAAVLSLGGGFIAGWIVESIK